MHGELKLHLECFEMGWWSDGANPVDIKIYSDGRVEDERPYINWASSLLGLGY